jgi:molybdopterin converting factor small subunit
MRSVTQIRLFGSLRNKLGDHYDPTAQLDLKEPTPLLTVLQSLNIPVDMVQMAMVNSKAVPKNSMISPGDHISLFPQEYLVFADWKDFRF